MMWQPNNCNALPPYLKSKVSMFLAVVSLLIPLLLWAGEEPYAPGELLVRFKTNVDETTISNFEKEYELRLLTEFPRLRMYHFGNDNAPYDLNGHGTLVASVIAAAIFSKKHQHKLMISREDF